MQKEWRSIVVFQLDVGAIAHSSGERERNCAAPQLSSWDHHIALLWCLLTILRYKWTVPSDEWGLSSFYHEGGGSKEQSNFEELYCRVFFFIYFLVIYFWLHTVCCYAMFMLTIFGNYLTCCWDTSRNKLYVISAEHLYLFYSSLISSCCYIYLSAGIGSIIHIHLVFSVLVSIYVNAAFQKIGNRWNKSLDLSNVLGHNSNV